MPLPTSAAPQPNQNWELGTGHWAPGTGHAFASPYVLSDPPCTSFISS